jgi:hypothetical protein
MSENLPTGNYKWLTVDQINAFDVATIFNDSETGYFVECDLEYPIELHDTHNDYPLAPENIKITKNMLSPYNKKALKKNNNTHITCAKLIPNLMNKSKYICHYKNLQLYLSLGMKLTKVHRILSFDQSAWMKPYIDFNTEQRKSAKNDFEVDFYKLMNNSVFGKTMENVREHIHAKICLNEKQASWAIRSPRFKNRPTMFDNDYGFFELEKKKVFLNKPIIVGMCVLDLSKTIMYDFHYNFIQKKYGNKAKPLFTDIDSLVYEISTEDIFQDMINHKELFDLSNFPIGHKCHDITNKKTLAKMKLETVDKIITEFVGLRSKMYSLKIQDDQDKKTAKGVKKSIKDNSITHEDYLNTLMTCTHKPVTQNFIRSFNHNVFSIQQTKIGLSPVNDKKYLLQDGTSGYSYSHYKILH